MDFDRATTLEAARLSIQHAIAMADSVMLATARRNGTPLWTQDSDFEELAGVRYHAKRCLRRASVRLHRLGRSEEHTSELQSLRHLVCRLLLEKKKQST